MEIKIYSNLGADFVPLSASEECAGYDVFSPESFILSTRTPFKFLDLGIVVNGPKYDDNGNMWCFNVFPRSSSIKYLISLVNTIPVIDSSYRGPKDTIKLALKFSTPQNHKSDGIIGSNVMTEQYGNYIEINKGDRIAQLVFTPILKPTLVFAGTPEDILSVDSRGGFGSTGK